VLTATNKLLLISESHGDSNWCTLCRKTRPTRHTHPTLSLCMVPDHTYLTRLMHSNLSWVAGIFGWISLLLRKMNSRLYSQHVGWPIYESPSSFSLTLNQRSSRLKPSFCRQHATRLTGHISLTCDRYVQYLFTGPNPSVLNRHRRSYNHLRSPPDLNLFNLNINL
jgi:hypothetical protein